MQPNTDEDVVRAITEFQRRVEWNLFGLDLAKWSARIEGWVWSLWRELIPHQWGKKDIELRPVLITFAPDLSPVLGHFRPGRNQHGLLYELNVNPVHMLLRTEMDTAAVVLHELFHVAEDLAGSAPKSRKGYHSSELRSVAGRLGVPCTRDGRELPRPEGPTPFNEWALRHAVLRKPPSANVQPDNDPPTPRKPTRRFWTCGCRIKLGLAAGVELHAVCQDCHRTFEAPT